MEYFLEYVVNINKLICFAINTRNISFLFEISPNKTNLPRTEIRNFFLKVYRLGCILYPVRWTNKYLVDCIFGRSENGNKRKTPEMVL